MKENLFTGKEKYVSKKTISTLGVYISMNVTPPFQFMMAAWMAWKKQILIGLVGSEDNELPISLQIPW